MSGLPTQHSSSTIATHSVCSSIAVREWHRNTCQQQGDASFPKAASVPLSREYPLPCSSRLRSVRWRTYALQVGLRQCSATRLWSMSTRGPLPTNADARMPSMVTGATTALATVGSLVPTTRRRTSWRTKLPAPAVLIYWWRCPYPCLSGHSEAAAAI